MSFLAPIWLLALIPWGVVVVWLMQRRRRPTGVPFLDLWRGPVHPPKPTRQFARPPIPLLMTMLAMLLALLAAARPAITKPTAGAGRPIQVIVDRGAGMSAGTPRFLASLHNLPEPLMNAGVAPLQTLDVQFVPSTGASKRTDVSDLSSLAAPVTAVDTHAALTATVARALAESEGPILVLSDQKLGVDDARIVQVPPAALFRNVCIVRIAARSLPAPQVMVTLAARGRTGPVNAIVSSAGTETAATFDPPGDGQTHNAFVDLPALGPTIEVKLTNAGDDASADNAAWLVRRGAWPRIEPRVQLSSAVQRVVDSYVANRPAGEGSVRVAITDDPAKAGDGPAVVLAAGGIATVANTTQVNVTPHPLTKDVDFTAVRPATVVVASPTGWTPLVRRGDQVWLAVREAPARQGWIGFDAPEWARNPDFVVFWAALFDWLGQGEPTYVSQEIGSLGPEWSPADPPFGEARLWPGLYRRAEGSLAALNSGLIAPGPVLETGWKQRLGLLRTGGGWSLSPFVLLAALGCLLWASVTWKRASLTEISGKTTVATDGVLTEAQAARP